MSIRILNEGRHSRSRERDTPLRICIGCRWFGARSQVWLWRQTVALRELSPTVITWRQEHAHDYPLPGIPLRITATPEQHPGGFAKWLHRVRHVSHGNLFAATDLEREQLKRLIQESGADAILCHFGHIALRFLPVARALELPIVPHFHGEDISSALNDRYYRWSLKRSLKHFEHIICVGKQQRERLLQIGAPSDKISIIPCGVPTKEFVRVARPDRPPTFLCVCRLVPWKGIDIVIRAFARTLVSVPNSKLIIVGDGRELPTLRQLSATLGVDKAVTFAGSHGPEAVLQYMHQSDIFIQHSLTWTNGWFEGFGVSTAEAASTGMPVVVSDCGGLTDQVLNGTTGIIVRQGSVEQTAQAMISLGSDYGLRSRLGAAGAERMRAYFDSDRQAARVQAILEHVVAVPSSRH